MDFFLSVKFATSLLASLAGGKTGQSVILAIYLIGIFVSDNALLDDAKELCNVLSDVGVKNLTVTLRCPSGFDAMLCPSRSTAPAHSSPAVRWNGISVRYTVIPFVVRDCSGLSGVLASKAIWPRAEVRCTTRIAGPSSWRKIDQLQRQCE